MTRFCTHCAARDDDLGAIDALLRRVCPRCELGMLLSASTDLVAGSGDALLVVTEDLRIGAASAAVEPILGAPLIGRWLPGLLEAEDVALRAVACARGADGVTSHRVEFDGRALSARIGPCGDPPAALVALAPA